MDPIAEPTHAPEATTSLRASTRPLCEAYDVAMLDLDGVVYVDGEAVPGAPAHLRRAREGGLSVAFVTNNASRTPEAVADHLHALGVPAERDQVVTSAQAAAALLRERLGEGTPVAVLGGAGLIEATEEVGLRPVGVDERALALVTGYGPEVRWREVMRAAVLIRDGTWWVATNTDSTMPTAYGVAPGHGLLVETLRRFSQVEPTVAGKPSPPLLRQTVERTAAARPLMVGDRLDTDILGGRNVGVDTLLVLTGVTGLRELVAVREHERPTYLSTDLGGLLSDHPAVSAGPDGAVEVGGWITRVERGACSISGEGSAEDWWRAVAVAAWTHLDRTGEVLTVDGLELP